MSTDTSPLPQTHVQNVNVRPSDDNICDGVSASVKHDDLVRNSALFWEKLYALLGFTSDTLRIPTLGGSTLDLHLLYVEVTFRGGIDKVTKDRKFKEVTDAFGLPTTITNASFYLRRYYFKFLYQLEQVYYHENPVSPVQPTDEAMENLPNESPNLEEGIDEPQVGNVFHGFIDGTFDGGYLMTMKVGSEEWKGVVFLPPTPDSATEASTQRRYKKKSKLAVVDSQKPKCHRSGYNFFFAEQYARLKPEYVGQERTITKTIGHMWSSLTDAERQVYQDKGFKDVERYRMEMLEYKSSHESGGAGPSTAAQ